MRLKHWLAIVSSITLGLIFLITGVGKLLDQTGLIAILVETTILNWRLVELIAQWLPWLELVLGLSLIVGIAAKFMASASGLLVIGFIFHNSWIIKYGIKPEDCACLGFFEKQWQIMLSAETARYMDIGMLALLLIVLFCYPGKLFTLRPWFLRQRKMNSGLRKQGDN